MTKRSKESVAQVDNEVKEALASGGELVVAPVEINPQALIQAAVETGAGMETLERLVALYKDVRAERAKAAWHKAMAEFQRTCPPILKTATAQIRTRTGAGYSYSFAPLQEILGTVQPHLAPLGLSVSFRVKHGPNQVIASARISHEFGHFEESGEVQMPVVDEGSGANAAQRVGIASTYAKRYALLAILGLAPESDTDAGKGEPPKVEQPRRASDAGRPEEAGPKPAPAPQPQKSTSLWVGTVLSVDEKRGKGWTLYSVRGEDGMTFSTFDAKHARFAREAGRDPVEVEWEEKKSKDGTKSYASIVNIGPHTAQEDDGGDGEREPGSDDE